MRLHVCIAAKQVRITSYNVCYTKLLRIPLDYRYSDTELLSFFTRMGYTFNNKYSFTGTFRADGSSKFAEGNKFSYFPSFAFAWRVKNESFMKNVDAISNLKVVITSYSIHYTKLYEYYFKYYISDDAALTFTASTITYSTIYLFLVV